MAATRFEGAGPVARYWLAHCEGFTVKGGADGVVEELIRDADPHVTTRLVVRTGHRRRRIVAAGAVAAVVPAERLVVVERRRRRRPHVRKPTLPAVPRARFRGPARSAARLARPALNVLIRSIRMLGAEAQASADTIIHSMLVSCSRASSSARARFSAWRRAARQSRRRRPPR